MKRFLLLSIMILLLPGCKYYTGFFQKNVDLQGKKEAFVHIPTGSDLGAVVHILDSMQVLVDVDAFRWAAEQKGYDEKIRPGRFEISDGMTNRELINKLQGAQAPVKVSFHYVRTIEQLAGKIGSRIEADSTELLAYFRDAEAMKKYNATPQTAATLFLPNTYEFYWNTNAEEFTAKMFREYEKFWNEERRAKAKAIGLSPSEVVILAGIVQAEQSAKQDEWPVIAGLYINRINSGMPLQSDPTVIFAQGDFTIRRVLFRHLEIDSPYNTYKYAGLPPGPIMIAEPGAVDAVLDYKKHDYYYMCASDDLSGYHKFAETLAEHNINARRYQQALNRKGIR